MRHRLPAVALATLVLLPILPWPVAADTPTRQLRADMARVFEALDAPEPRVALQTVSRDLFDWNELAQRALGQHWAALTPPEREEFMVLLQRLVDARIARLAGYGAGAVAYVGEVIEGERATVRTAVADASGRGVTLDYQMVWRTGRWLIYDVVLDGASMAANYRAQFARIIKKASYAGLVERLASP